MTDQPNMNTLDTFVATTKAIRALDIPSKETADALVRSAMRMVAIDLSNGNLSGARHTVDQLEAVEKFLKRKVQQQQADRITQNIVAAGRYRTIREIGRWLIDNVDHGDNKTAGGVILSQDNKDNAVLASIAKVLTDLGIGNNTYQRWMLVGGLDDTEFENFLSPYLDETILQNMELVISKLYKLSEPSYPDGTTKKPEPPLSLAAHLKAVYLATAYLRGKLQSAQAEIDKGNTPKNQVLFIFDQFTDLVEDINAFMRHTSEMY